MLTTHQKKALDFSHHISLTANAGSGKTFVLSKRFVEIALQEDVKLNNIVAITFTERAAGELYKKISDEIEERLLVEKNESTISKLTQIRRRLVSANIATIHSFCIDILKEFSPEAGLDANFIPIDQFTANELLSLSIDECISKKLKSENDSGETKDLIRILKSKANLQNRLQFLVEKRKDVEKVKSKFFSGSLKESADLYQKVFEKEFRKIFIPRIKELIKCAETINNQALEDKPDNEYSGLITDALNHLKEENELLSIIKLCSTLNENILTKSGTVRRRGFLSNDACGFLAGEILLVEEFFNDLIKIEVKENSGLIHLDLASFGKKFLNLFFEVTEIYQRKKIDKGYLDFEDILIYTQKIIEIPEVKAHLSGKFKYIMVDEYQDTNEIQYEIFMPILDNLKRNNFFVVGDEKQSIYMFRNAEPEIFNRTKSEMILPEKAGNILELPHSFRMSPNIAAFTNYIFKNIFKGGSIDFNEVGYSEIICAGKDNNKSKVEILLADEETEVEEVELVAAKIIELLKENPELSFSDIAILCRKRNSFMQLEQTFIKYEIPYLIIGGKGFYQRQIIYDIKNYLSFLINSNDDASLIGILRSPFFNLSDLNIYEISLERGNSFYEKLINFSVKDNKIKKIISDLEINSDLAARGDFAFLIRKILNETGYWAIVAAKINSDQELANLKKVINLANKFSQESFKTLYDYVEFLDESIETMDDESQAQVSSDENALRIMTIHQSKGLEFKAVFLYETNSRGKDDKVNSGNIAVDKKFGILTHLPVEENYFAKYSAPPIVGMYNFIQMKKNLAELKRLFYVGITRAEDFLFISASAKEYKAGKGTFFSLLKEGLQFNGSEEVINLRTELETLDRDTMKSSSRGISLTIPIIKSADEIKNPFVTKTEISLPKKIAFNKIDDKPEGEIISATKIAVFNQCPVKYELTYELGFSKFINLLRNKEKEIDFNEREDEELNEAADLKGSIIHSILQDEIEEKNFDYEINGLLENQYFERSRQIINPENFAAGIKQDLLKLYSSSFFKKISKKNNYKNEFELYTGMGKYYLYGIIDKLIIEEDKVIILDYKTDNIKKSEVIEESGRYTHQLNFYALLVNKLFPGKNVETILLFVKHPDQPVIKNYYDKEIESIGKKLNEDIINIHEKKFEPNREHCKYCRFFEKGKCLKEVKNV